MWQLVIFNALWFLFLFLIHLYCRKISQFAVLFAVFVSAVVVIYQKITIDPMVWLAYILSSLVTLWSGLQFRRWVFAKGTVLDEETRDSTKKLEMTTSLLATRSRETEEINQKANDIY